MPFCAAPSNFWVRLLDLLDEFGSRVTQLAAQFHNGDISHDGYATAIKDAETTWQTKLAERHRIHGG
jgi:hypothetical protein